MKISEETVYNYMDEEYGDFFNGCDEYN